MERTVTATEFRAQCLALLDEVEETGQTLLITKDGRTFAQVTPTNGMGWPRDRPHIELLGSVTWRNEEDIVGPTGEPWPGEDEVDD